MNHKEFTTSSQVKTIDYNESTKEMDVLFVVGKKYRYTAVPKEVFEKACDAESIGKFINSEIKGKFLYTLIS